MQRFKFFKRQKIYFVFRKRKNINNKFDFIIINSMKRQILNFFEIKYVFEFVKKFKKILFLRRENNFDNNVNIQFFCDIVSNCFERFQNFDNFFHKK